MCFWKIIPTLEFWFAGIHNLLFCAISILGFPNTECFQFHLIPSNFSILTLLTRSPNILCFGMNEAILKGVIVLCIFVYFSLLELILPSSAYTCVVMLWVVLKTPSQETKKLPDFTWCQSFHVLKGFRESGPICMNNWELPFHWWSRWDGQKEGPAASLLLLLLVHTFIQVFHYILRAGPIPQECTRQHIRARVQWRWSCWQE